jgi:2-methylaconitate cis-trans-isomerase PrpF
MLRQHVLDHVLVHDGYHAGRVRMVPSAEVEQGVADLQLLFPHDTVLTTALACGHSCVYTDDAAASLVAERIAEHLRDFDHSTGERRTRAKAESKQGLGREVWQ